MSRYSAMFSNLAQKKQGAFIPFVTLGDPHFELSLQIIDCLIENGADALELGFPFSEPLADGPTIQNAMLRALNAGITTAHCFEILAIIRKKYPNIPIGLLMYANLVFCQGIEYFYQRCAEVGVDSVLIADVPLSESPPFRNAALKHNIDAIFICPPNADNQFLMEIAQHSRGYLYLVSRAGVTGKQQQDIYALEHLIHQLHQYHAAPILLGFGISEPFQVKQAIQSGVAGAISGSAIAEIIAQHHTSPLIMLNKLAQFIQQMKAATD